MRLSPFSLILSLYYINTSCIYFSKRSVCAYVRPSSKCTKDIRMTVRPTLASIAFGITVLHH